MTTEEIDSLCHADMHALCREQAEKLAAIEGMCLRRNNSSVTPNVQLFAREVLRVIGREAAKHG